MHALPDDVDPRSRCRLPLARREELDAQGRAVYDHLTDPATTSLVGLRGPAGIRLHSPIVAHHMHALNRYFRTSSAMPARAREIAILVTAREHDSQFEWAAHEPQARKEGVEDAIIEAIRHQRELDGLAAADRTLIAFARQLYRERRVASALFAEALALFGREVLVDLVSVMTLYAATASLLAAFDMQLPEGVSPGLPETGLDSAG